MNHPPPFDKVPISNDPAGWDCDPFYALGFVCGLRDVARGQASDGVQKLSDPYNNGYSDGVGTALVLLKR